MHNFECNWDEHKRDNFITNRQSEGYELGNEVTLQLVQRMTSMEGLEGFLCRLGYLRGIKLMLLRMPQHKQDILMTASQHLTGWNGIAGDSRFSGQQSAGYLCNLRR